MLPRIRKNARVKPFPKKENKSCPVNAGVLPGFVLSPTLFFLNINDLVTIAQHPIYRFADDTTLISLFSFALLSVLQIHSTLLSH